MWECGLKRSRSDDRSSAEKVTPHVGVWIETIIDPGNNLNTNESLPMWECGLKPQQLHAKGAVIMSLPMWECGLKRFDAL